MATVSAPTITTSVDVGVHNGAWSYWTGGSYTHTNNTIIVGTTVGDIWQVWIDSSNKYTASSTPPTAIIYGSREPETAEAIALRAEVARTRKLELDRVEAERQLAEVKADALLAEFCDAMQRDQIEKKAEFIVLTESGKRYRVKRNQRVAELDSQGNLVAYYCIHPRESVPSGDVMLAQKLMLETEEARFLQIANRYAA